MEVETANDEEEAIHKATSGDFQIIALDLKFPGMMDGIESLKRLKGEGRRADIVMVTGYGNVSTAVEAMKMGTWDFIEKPFMPDNLLSMAEDILLSQIRQADPVVGHIQQNATEIGSRKDAST